MMATNYAEEIGHQEFLCDFSILDEVNREGM